jgi:hypothetical protein
VQGLHLQCVLCSRNGGAHWDSGGGVLLSLAVVNCSVVPLSDVIIAFFLRKKKGRESLDKKKEKEAVMAEGAVPPLSPSCSPLSTRDSDDTHTYTPHSLCCCSPLLSLLPVLFLLGGGAGMSLDTRHYTHPSTRGFSFPWFPFLRFLHTALRVSPLTTPSYDSPSPVSRVPSSHFLVFFNIDRTS